MKLTRTIGDIEIQFTLPEEMSVSEEHSFWDRALEAVRFAIDEARFHGRKPITGVANECGCWLSEKHLLAMPAEGGGVCPR